MMDKIRILWVHDTPDEGIPGRILPKAYQPYFELCFRNSDQSNEPVMSLSAFANPLRKFWFSGDNTALPAEILAVDYDLAKRPSQGVRSEEREQPLSYKERKAQNVQRKYDYESLTTEVDVDFDGLLLAIFYATLTYDHPAGFVPITYQMKKMPASVGEFQRLTEPYLGIDFGFIGTERNWENIINAAVNSLRSRIETLHFEGLINLSFDNLMAIYDGNAETLIIRSKHAIRHLPIRGLFIDLKDDEFSVSAKQWAEKLLCDIVGEGQLDSLRRANQVADELWIGYNNDVLFENRWRLSELSNRRDDLTEDETREMAELTEYFGVDAEYTSCSRNTIDLRNYDLDNATRRWAALFVLLRLIGRLVTTQKNWQEITGRTANPLCLDEVGEEDWMLALYPVAKDPIILFSSEYRSERASDIGQAWASNLYRNRDEFAINPLHVIRGYAWGQPINRGKAYGLRPAERRILLEKALDMEGLTKKDWEQCKLAQTIFYGA